MATLRRNQDDPKVGVLRTLPGFKDCTDSELGTFARWLDECEVAKGEVLSTENGAGREMYILVEGFAEARRGGILLWECGPATCWVRSASEWPPATATITARTPLRLLALLPAAHAQVFELPGVARWVRGKQPGASDTSSTRRKDGQRRRPTRRCRQEVLRARGRECGRGTGERRSSALLSQ